MTRVRELATVRSDHAALPAIEFAAVGGPRALATAGDLTKTPSDKGRRARRGSSVSYAAPSGVSVVNVSIGRSETGAPRTPTVCGKV